MRLIAILLAMIVATFVRQAVAHPHVFIAWHIEPQIEKGAIAAVKLHWRFDDLYSDLVLNTIDRDGDRKLSPAEIDALAKRTSSIVRARHTVANVSRTLSSACTPHSAPSSSRTPWRATRAA